MIDVTDKPIPFDPTLLGGRGRLRNYKQALEQLLLVPEVEVRHNGLMCQVYFDGTLQAEGNDIIKMIEDYAVFLED